LKTLLSLEEAQARLLGLAPRMPGEDIAVEDALGRVLGSDLAALRTQPAADLSAMDGYALPPGGSFSGPWELVGESRAGASYKGALGPRQCTRISTGAHMPQGSDRVLIQENAAVEGQMVSSVPVHGELPDAGRHVRVRGFDFGEGDSVLRAGTRMGPAQIALAIAAGHGRMAAIRPPRVAILDSGDELVRDPARCGPDQIPASNGPMIAAMLHPLIGAATRLGPVPDDLDALARALASADQADILITSGGASVGDHDLIQRALGEWGADLAFWKVAIKPGKPLMVATRQSGGGRQVILGLPGNPVSSFVTCFLFALPLMRAAMGAGHPLPQAQSLPLREDLPATGPRREFLRGVIEAGTVGGAATQDSSALLALAAANCLIDRPAGAPALTAGESVPVYNLQNG
jgi:molybdopterin molybdotransferase